MVEADSKHRLLITEPSSLEEEFKVLTALAIKEDVGENEGELSNGASTKYRRVATRANYLVVDRADTQFAVKEACRGMSKPGQGELRRTRRLVRCSKGTQAATVGGSNPEAVRKNVVYVDSGWAGCKTSRKSTGGSVLIAGRMLLESRSPIHAAVATSSGEAEYNALVRGAAVALGLTAALGELGWEIPIDIMIDSAAAKVNGVLARTENEKSGTSR